MPHRPPVSGISTSAVPLQLPASNREHLVLTNTGTVTVFLGGSTVTVATGLPFPPGSRAELHNNSGAVYAIAAAGATGSVSVNAGAG